MINSFDYTKVNSDVTKMAKGWLKEAGYKLVSLCKLSNNPSDNYLYLVMGYGSRRGEYATWVYNNSTDSLGDGHYGMDFKSGLIDYANRLC